MFHTTRRPTATHKAVTQADRLTILSDSWPAGLVQSTGNLYWTSNVHSSPVELTGTSRVYRASKSNIPGQETILYQETMTNDGIAAVNFGSLTYAQVSGNWLAYFVANYPPAGYSQIKYVPLTGGQAKALPHEPHELAQIGNGDLATDGTSLYWADATGIQKMPIGGGAVTTLASGDNLAHLALFEGRVYYSAGNSILSVATTGGAPSTVVNTESEVTTFTVTAAPNVILRSAKQAASATPPIARRAQVIWGEYDGAVMSDTGGQISTITAAASGTHVTSVSVADGRVLWGNYYGFNTGATIYESYGGEISLLTDLTYYPVTDLQGDSTAMYWSSEQLLKYVF